jgi:hypothetical protein
VVHHSQSSVSPAPKAIDDASGDTQDDGVDDGRPRVVSDSPAAIEPEPLVMPIPPATAPEDETTIVCATPSTECAGPVSSFAPRKDEHEATEGSDMQLGGSSGVPTVPRELRCLLSKRLLLT